MTPTESVLRVGPVAEFFAPAEAVFIRNARQHSGIDQDPDEDDGLAMAHMRFVESVLLYVAELHHGGTLLFVPEEMTHDDARIQARLSIKYVLPSTRPRDALVSSMSARLKYNAAAETLDGRRTVKGERLEQDYRHWQMRSKTAKTLPGTPPGSSPRLPRWTGRWCSPTPSASSASARR